MIRVPSMRILKRDADFREQERQAVNAQIRELSARLDCLQHEADDVELTREACALRARISGLEICLDELREPDHEEVAAAWKSYATNYAKKYKTAVKTAEKAEKAFYAAFEQLYILQADGRENLAIARDLDSSGKYILPMYPEAATATKSYLASHSSEMVKDVMLGGNGD